MSPGSVRPYFFASTPSIFSPEPLADGIATRWPFSRLIFSSMLSFSAPAISLSLAMTLFTGRLAILKNATMRLPCTATVSTCS